jgi:hypothetical protein
MVLPFKSGRSANTTRTRSGDGFRREIPGPPVSGCPDSRLQGAQLALRPARIIYHVNSPVRVGIKSRSEIRRSLDQYGGGEAGEHRVENPAEQWYAAGIHQLLGPAHAAGRSGGQHDAGQISGCRLAGHILLSLIRTSPYNITLGQAAGPVPPPAKSAPLGRFAAEGDIYVIQSP